MKKACVMIYPEFSMQEISCLTELFKFYGKEIEVFASEKKLYSSEDGFDIMPHKTFEAFDFETFDCLIMPGIWDFRPAYSDERNIEFLRKIKENPDFVIASISSSPLLLAKAGVLENHKFCSGLFEEVIEEYTEVPRQNIVRVPVCEDGRLITAVGFAFREFANAVAKRVGIDCSPHIFDPIKETYTDEELTFHIPEEFIE